MADSTDPTDSMARLAGMRGRLRGVVDEARERPLGYGVLAIFLIAGPIVAPMIFPDAPPAAGVIGGLIFGGYAALCAVPEKFF